MISCIIFLRESFENTDWFCWGKIGTKAGYGAGQNGVGGCADIIQKIKNIINFASYLISLIDLSTYVISRISTDSNPRVHMYDLTLEGKSNHENGGKGQRSFGFSSWHISAREKDYWGYWGCNPFWISNKRLMGHSA